MFTVLFCKLLFISSNVFVDSLPSVSHLRNEYDEIAETAFVNRLDPMDITIRFSNGIVPYYIAKFSYDRLIKKRIRTAMDIIEASSCVIFKELEFPPMDGMDGSWIHVSNPLGIRECVHQPQFGDGGEINIVIGFDCMTTGYVLHAVLHGIGFKDEVSHPQRDQYIRIVWNNIQPRYRDLFSVRQQDPRHQLIEYDPTSIMHFHDRAFSINGGATIAPRVPGLHIQPSDNLSQLDVMKLRIWFGHECNKRKASAVIEKCKTALYSGKQKLRDENGSVDVDHIEDNQQSSIEPEYQENDEYAENSIEPGDQDNYESSEVDANDQHIADYQDTQDCVGGQCDVLDMNVIDSVSEVDEADPNLDDGEVNVDDGEGTVDDGEVNEDHGAFYDDEAYTDAGDDEVNENDGGVSVDDVNVDAGDDEINENDAEVNVDDGDVDAGNDEGNANGGDYFINDGERNIDDSEVYVDNAIGDPYQNTFE